MAEIDEWDEEKFTELEIPPFTLPALRDFGIHFIALIEFDLFMGPVVYLKEIKTGSTFINQLYDIRKLSEVYAGLARTNLDNIGVNAKLQGEQIAVARFDPNGDEDITSVLLISCLPDANLTDVQALAEKTITRAGGQAENMQDALQNAVKEVVDKISTSYTTTKTDQSIDLRMEERPMKSLGLNHINGFFLIDLGTNSADFRNLPVWLNNKNYDPKEILKTLEPQFAEIQENEITTIFVKSLPFLATKIPDKKIYSFLSLQDTGIRVANSIGNWFSTCAMVIAEEWKQASKSEVHSVLSLLDEATYRGTPINRVSQVSRILIRSERIKPVTNTGVEFDFDIQPPTFIAASYWNDLKELEGKLSIAEISELWVDPVMNVVHILEWARTRDLIVFVQ